MQKDLQITSELKGRLSELEDRVPDSTDPTPEADTVLGRPINASVEQIKCTFAWIRAACVNELTADNPSPDRAADLMTGLKDLENCILQAQAAGKPSILDSTDEASEQKKVELANHLRAAIEARRKEQEEGQASSSSRPNRGMRNREPPTDSDNVDAKRGRTLDGRLGWFKIYRFKISTDSDSYA